MILDDIRYRWCRSSDVAQCAKLEAASYPVDEAATLSTLQYRQQNAGQFFLVATVASSSAATIGSVQNIEEIENDNNNNNTTEDGNNYGEQIVGFICSTRCSTFTHATMTVHAPNAVLLAIHSVVVQESYRRKKFGTHMLKEYIQRIQQHNNNNNGDTIEKILLLSKAHLLPFYVQCGFRVMRPSSIVHGMEQWYDLEMDLAVVQRDNQKAYYVIDAFADPTMYGTGNPAAVVPLSKEPSDDHWMQTVAQEFNLSETAFIWPLASSSHQVHDDEVHYGIRYFTPTVEVPLCGHATLASAAALVQSEMISSSFRIVFHAPKDILRATAVPSNDTTASGNSDRSRCTNIAMEFPAIPVREYVSPDELHAVHSMLQSAFPTSMTGTIDQHVLYCGIADGVGDILVEVTPSCFHSIGYDADTLNVNALVSWDGYTRGVIICCRGQSSPNDREETTTNDIDFYSRFFGPKAGVDEDPVTGSAHCVLAPYFAARLGVTSVVLVGKQASKRGGIVLCQLISDGKDADNDGPIRYSHVRLTGTAVQTMTGTLWM